jgi:hypothetical protein
LSAFPVEVQQLPECLAQGLRQALGRPVLWQKRVRGLITATPPTNFHP